MHAWADNAGENTAPLAEAVAIVLGAFHGPDQVSWRGHGPLAPFQVFSYREDFNYLWNFDSGLLTGLGPACHTLVLIWDETPPDTEPATRDFNIHEFVTAFDWAVALGFRKAWAESGPSETSFPWRVFILDCASERYPASDTVRVFQRLQQGSPPFLPWIRTWQPTELDAFLNALREEKAVEVSAGDLRLAKRLWSSTLLNPTDLRSRHTIANIVGPELLLGAMELPASSASVLRANSQDPTTTEGTTVLANHRTSLSRLMEAIGLLPTEVDIEKAPWVDPSEWSDVVDTFVLVDDMHELGWAKFLRMALGIPAKSPILRVTDNPDHDGLGSDANKRFVSLSRECSTNPSGTSVSQPGEWLDLLTDLHGHLCLNQGISLTEEPRREILFLDLRLFSSRSKEEFNFFARLGTLAAEAMEGTKDLRWPGFTEDELAKVVECVRTECSETEGYYIALTLLPRLIALVDPYLPIVLFSSTGQKHIVDRLSRYGTIVLDFDKPRFFSGASAEIVSEIKVAFVRALRRALLLARGRGFLSEVSKSANFQSGKQNSPPTRTSTKERRLVEFYLDETGNPGDPNFQVGGLAVLYPNGPSASIFSIALRNIGLVWGWDRDSPWDASPPNPLKKLSDFKRHHGGNWQGVVKSRLGELMKLAQGHNLWMAYFSLARPSGPLAPMPWSGPDHLYRGLLRDAIELLLFDWLPTHFKGEELDIGVYVATRRWDAKESILDLLASSRIFGVLLREDQTRNAPPAFKVFDDRAVNFRSVAAMLTDKDHAYVRDYYGLKLYAPSSLVPPGITPPGRDCDDLLAWSFSSDDVHPLMTDISTERPDTSILTNLAFAAGVRLSYYSMYPNHSNVTPHQLPRQIHYAADWLVGNASLIPQKARSTMDEIAEIRDEAFLALLRSSRLADEPGREIDALREFHRAGPQDRAMRRLVTPRVAACARQLAGKEFVRLCELLNAGG